MPGGDRTGPFGYGPMTGRGMGCCGRSGAGRAYGPGRVNWYGGGRGRGWRHRYFATGAPGWNRFGGGGWWAGPPQYPGWGAAGEDLAGLREYAAGLESELANIKSRIGELEQERKGSAASNA